MNENTYPRHNHFMVYFKALPGKTYGEWCYTSVNWNNDAERKAEMLKLEAMGYPAAICHIDLLEKGTGRVLTDGYIRHGNIMDSPHYETLNKLYGKEGYDLIRG
jgi:hypothetical protein